MAPIHFDAAAYHRNGVGGAGFFRVLFRLRDGRRWRQMQAVVFDAADHVAVIDEEGHSWRCEDFEPQLRQFLDSPDGQAMVWPNMRHLLPANEA